MDVRKVLIGVVFVTMIGVMSYAIYRFYKLEFTKALNYCYQVSGVHFNNVSINNINMDVSIRLKNQSTFDVTLTGYDFDIYVNNKLISTVKSDVPQNIANQSVSTLVANVQFDPSKFFDLAYITEFVVYAVNDRSNFIIEVKGSFSAKLNFIAINYPLDFKMSLEDILTPSDPGAADEHASKDKCQIV